MFPLELVSRKRKQWRLRLQMESLAVERQPVLELELASLTAHYPAVADFVRTTNKPGRQKGSAHKLTREWIASFETDHYQFETYSIWPRKRVATSKCLIHQPQRPRPRFPKVVFDASRFGL